MSEHLTYPGECKHFKNAATCPKCKTEPAYTEQDLQVAYKTRTYEDIAAEFARIRSEARAGMREACAKYFEDKNKQKGHAITWHLILRAVVEDIRNLLDTAADEAIERIKRKARLEIYEEIADMNWDCSDYKLWAKQRIRELTVPNAGLSGKEIKHD